MGKKSREKKDHIIFKQEYPGNRDHINHFYRLLSAFKDERYIKVDGKLLFVIFDVNNFPNISEFKELWNSLAKKKWIIMISFCYNVWHNIKN